MSSRNEQVPRRRSDGEETHTAILDAAMRLASIEGLSSLTVGRLGRELGISKSGVFAHFRSKQHLQQETIRAASQVYQREVLEPGLAAPQGLARLEALCEAHLSYIERGVFPGGCFFAQLLAEFDAPDGPIHDEVVAGQQGWIGLLIQQVETAQHCGDVHPTIDPYQLAFELYAALELANYLCTLYRDPSIIERGRAAVRSAIARVTPSETSDVAPKMREADEPRVRPSRRMSAEVGLVGGARAEDGDGMSV